MGKKLNMKNELTSISFKDSNFERIFFLSKFRLLLLDVNKNKIVVSNETP